jgi:hypothetical protein
MILLLSLNDLIHPNRHIACDRQPVIYTKQLFQSPQITTCYTTMSSHSNDCTLDQRNLHLHFADNVQSPPSLGFGYNWVGLGHRVPHAIHGRQTDGHGRRLIDRQAELVRRIPRPDETDGVGPDDNDSD